MASQDSEPTTQPPVSIFADITKKYDDCVDELLLNTTEPPFEMQQTIVELKTAKLRHEEVVMASLLSMKTTINAILVLRHTEREELENKFNTSIKLADDRSKILQEQLQMAETMQKERQIDWENRTSSLVDDIDELAQENELLKHQIKSMEDLNQQSSSKSKDDGITSTSNTVTHRCVRSSQTDIMGVARQLAQPIILQYRQQQPILLQSMVDPPHFTTQIQPSPTLQSKSVRSLRPKKQ
jgi:hypothetical protein